MGKLSTPSKSTNPPYGAEVIQALDMIRAGKSDGAIAAAISAARKHGQFRVDPQHIAQLRKGA